MEKLDGSTKLPINQLNTAQAPQKSCLRKKLPIDGTVSTVAQKVISKEVTFRPTVAHRTSIGREHNKGYAEQFKDRNDLNLRDPKDSGNFYTKKELREIEAEVFALMQKKQKMPLTEKEQSTLDEKLKMQNQWREYFSDGKPILSPKRKKKKKSEATLEEKKKNELTNYTSPSYNTLTNTHGSTIRFMDNSPSWRDSEELIGILNVLRDQSIKYLKQHETDITEKTLLTVMFNLRPYNQKDQKEEFSKIELYEIYHDLFLKNLGHRPEKSDPDKYLVYLEKYLPKTTDGKVDENRVKTKVKDELEIQLEMSSNKADYSSISENDLRDYIVRLGDSFWENLNK